jgi:outer membrane protein OmpA-like peptidoglycan-associated protein
MRRSLPFAILLLAASAIPGGARADDLTRFVIYFGSWSALIEPAAQQAVAAAAAAAKQNAAAPVIVTGYASTVGSVAANTLLSQLRAQIVNDELLADGVDASRITLTGTGPTTFLVEPVESRRVVIQVGNP